MNVRPEMRPRRSRSKRLNVRAEKYRATRRPRGEGGASARGSAPPPRRRAAQELAPDRLELLVRHAGPDSGSGTSGGGINRSAREPPGGVSGGRAHALTQLHSASSSSSSNSPRSCAAARWCAALRSSTARAPTADFGRWNVGIADDAVDAAAADAARWARSDAVSAFHLRLHLRGAGAARRRGGERGGERRGPRRGREGLARQRSRARRGHDDGATSAERRPRAQGPTRVPRRAPVVPLDEPRTFERAVSVGSPRRAKRPSAVVAMMKAYPVSYIYFISSHTISSIQKEAISRHPGCVWANSRR